MEYVDILYNSLVISNGDYNKFLEELNANDIRYLGFPDLLILRIIKEGHINSLIMMIENFGLNPNENLCLYDGYSTTHEKSLLNYALEYKQQQIAEMLILEKGAIVCISPSSSPPYNSQNIPILSAIKSGFLNIVQTIYETTKDIDNSYYDNSSFRSQLTLEAIQSNNCQTLHYLITLDVINFRYINQERYYYFGQKESWYDKYSLEVLQPLMSYINSNSASSIQSHNLSEYNIKNQIKIIKKYSQLIKELKSDKHNIMDNKRLDIIGQFKDLQTLIVDKVFNNSKPFEIAQYIFTESSKFAVSKTLDWSRHIHDNIDNEVIGNIAKFVYYDLLYE